MERNEWLDITVEQAKTVANVDSYIDNDLIMFDRFEHILTTEGSKRLQSLFVGLCVEGEATYVVNSKTHSVTSNDLIILSEGQLIESYRLSPDCKGVAIVSSRLFFQEVVKEVSEISALFLFANTGPVLHLTDEKKEMFLRCFSDVKSTVDNRDHHFRKEIVIAKLKVLIYEIGNEIWKVQQEHQPKNTRAESIFTEFILLVEQNFRQERRVGWYADRLHITPKYLSEAVKQVSRRTPTEWIDTYVVLEIRVLLKNTMKSIKEIAQELHFTNQSFLGKFFKEHVGISPSGYRRS